MCKACKYYLEQSLSTKWATVSFYLLSKPDKEMRFAIDILAHFQQVAKSLVELHVAVEYTGTLMEF